MPTADINSLSVNDIANSIIASVQNSEHQSYPYDHWLPANVLPESVADAITELPFEPALVDRYGGKRNDEDDKRIYFNGENRKKFAVCDMVAQAFDSEKVRKTFEKTCKADLSDGQLRLEYCQDIDGFWLEPHTDISVKKHTMLLYLSRDQELRDAGTDIYKGPPQQEKIEHYRSTPFEFNQALIFVPADNTWHGLEKRKINGVRKSLIINYVTSDWRERWELANSE